MKVCKDCNIEKEINLFVKNKSYKTDVFLLNHYTNLQPLCSYTNRYLKTSKINY